ncbi:MAG TPA: YihY/virulence factor BrkB family protein [Candidatus Sulfotelmatobacter sp.]|nr:YihY/virulence factor BrkB family protein [Candidatus Sulfotelmatobacter sp.]
MDLGAVKRAFASTYRDLVRHHTFQVSAALSYYFVLSVFPALIFLSAIVGFISLPDLFNHVLLLMGRLLPADTMKVVYSVLGDVLASHRGAWLSFGMLGMAWTMSAAFDSMIEALDIAYDVTDDRPFWKTRLLAIGLSAIIGALLLSALGVMLVGPRFGSWLAGRLELSAVFVAVWPVLRWTLAICFTILAVEVLYYLAPNVKQRFGATLPGAVLSVVVWNGLSFLLGYYFRHWANFNRTYGTLGGFIAFMTWLYWTSFVLLMGAELNAELAKESKKGGVPPKDAAPEERRRIDRRATLNRAA